MAKKRRHARTDKRSQERRAIRENWAKENRALKKRELLENYSVEGSETVARILKKPIAAVVSLKDLKKERSKARFEAKQTFQKLYKSFKTKDKEERRRKYELRKELKRQAQERQTEIAVEELEEFAREKRVARAKEIYVRKERIKAIAVEKAETARLREVHQFFAWFNKMGHIKNPHNYEWFTFNEQPYFNPRNKKEIERDKAIYRAMRKALANSNEEEAKRQFNDLANEVIRNLYQDYGSLFGKREKFDINSPRNLTLRGITEGFRNDSETAYWNYLHAARARGNDILYNAIKKGGTGFTDFLYQNKFTWADFYARNNGKYVISLDTSEMQFYEFCKRFANTGRYGKIFEQARKAYKNRER